MQGPAKPRSPVRLRMVPPINIMLLPILVGAIFYPTKSMSNPKVTLHTNHGDITLEIFADKVPKTAKNFVELAKKGYYDGTIFHRVITDFMIQ